MGQLLRGEKKALSLLDIKPVKVADRRFITVKRVCEQVKNNTVYMTYLPDNLQKCGRDFLFTIVNTLDPIYFRHAQKEVERRRISKAKKEETAKVEVSPEMMAIMEKYTDDHEDRPASTQSLAMLKLGAKKRRRVERQEVPHLQARIR